MKIYKSKNAKKHIQESYDQLLTMWNVEIEEKDIKTTYGTTHVIVCGQESNPPLVLFHGVGDDSALMWIYNAKDLATHFRIFAIDTLGGPGKSCPNENYNKTFNGVQWIDEVLDELKLEKIYMSGVSNGAYLTQYYGVHRAERVIKMVCMAGSISVGSAGASLKNMLKIFLPEALLPTKRNTEKLIVKLTGKNSGVFIDNQAIMAHYHYLLKGFNNMAMGYHKIECFSLEQIDTIREKVLFLVGNDDPFAKLGGKELLEKHQMNAKFFDHVGHGINHEISEEINRVLVDYLLA